MFKRTSSFQVSQSLDQFIEKFEQTKRPYVRKAPIISIMPRESRAEFIVKQEFASVFGTFTFAYAKGTLDKRDEDTTQVEIESDGLSGSVIGLYVEDET